MKLSEHVRAHALRARDSGLNPSSVDLLFHLIPWIGNAIFLCLFLSYDYSNQ